MVERISLQFIALFIGGIFLVLEGCSSSPRFVGGSTPNTSSPPATPEPSVYRSYSYLVTTDNCQCEKYAFTDGHDSLSYVFHASYKMYNGVVTDIEVEIKNDSRDTLFLDHAAAKVFSRNVPYMYNDKSLPLPILLITPGSSNTVHLSGEDRTGENDWHKIAGEQLTVTIQGLRLGDREITPRTITFIPQNPMMEK